MKTGFLLLAVAVLTGACNTRVPAKHDNLAEFHGACPKCSAVAVGHLVFCGQRQLYFPILSLLPTPHLWGLL